ncbi:MAG: hypothetical protein Q7S37_01360 [bacterium]|nr:hypothetical protein [bacterium]
MLVRLNSRVSSRRRHRTIKKQSVAMGPGALRFITIFILALLTLIYLIQSTKGSTKQMEITKLEDRAELLKNERQDIQIEAVRLKSLQNLKNNPDLSGFEQIGNAEDLSGKKN